MEGCRVRDHFSKRTIAADGGFEGHRRRGARGERSAGAGGCAAAKARCKDPANLACVTSASGDRRAST